MFYLLRLTIWPRNIDDKTGTLSDALNKLNIDDSSKDGDDHHFPQEQEMIDSRYDLPKAWRFVKDHPKEQIIGDASRGVKTRAQAQSDCGNLFFLSQVEPKNINEALVDKFWFLAMQKQLYNFERIRVWKLVSKPKSVPLLKQNRYLEINLMNTG